MRSFNILTAGGEGSVLFASKTTMDVAADGVDKPLISIFCEENVYFKGKTVALDADNASKILVENKEIALAGAEVESVQPDMHPCIFSPLPSPAPPPAMTAILMIPYVGEVKEDGASENETAKGKKIAVEGTAVEYKDKSPSNKHDQNNTDEAVKTLISQLQPMYNVSSPTWLADGSGPSGKGKVFAQSCAKSVFAGGKKIAIIKSKVSTCVMGQVMGTNAQIKQNKK